MNRKSYILFVAVFVAMAMNASSAIFVETWETDVSGWASIDLPTKNPPGYGGVSQNAGISPEENVLQITGGTASGVPKRDIIFGDSQGDGSSYDYHGGMFMSFDFYAEDDPPTQLDAYFRSDAGSRWYYTINDVVAGWNHFNIVMGATGWYGGSDLGADILSVDEVGIAIWYRPNEGGQIYALDNFAVVPEPATIAMLLVVFMSLGVTFRKKLRTSLALVRIR